MRARLFSVFFQIAKVFALHASAELSSFAQRTPRPVVSTVNLLVPFTYAPANQSQNRDDAPCIPDAHYGS
jgi:hypothetical protein